MTAKTPEKRMRCELCYGPTSVQHDGVDVCSTCLMCRGEVRLMVDAWKQPSWGGDFAEPHANAASLMAAVIDCCSFPGIALTLKHDGPRPYLQCVAAIRDNDTEDDQSIQRGRKWMLSPHMTRSEIVQTCLAAVFAFVEHEARERFLYRGEAIFGPHFNVEKLHELATAKAVELRSTGGPEATGCIQ
jgi:hypothetical protein